jgi:ABC-2 type transport system permease protein
MQTTLPSSSAALTSLLRADLTTQWRNRKSSIMVILVPVIILVSWKSLVARIGGAYVLSNAITVGVTAIGLMGYTISIARDRDKGIFQRLRVAPLPNWSIMTSRLLVQMVMIILMTLAVFAAGYKFDNISLGATGYALTLLTAIASGAVYLSLGQIIVGLIKNPETVNATTRLVYFGFIMIGMFGELGVLGDKIKGLVKWSPYGVVNQILASSLQPSTWNATSSMALLVTIGYTIVFATLGIKWFRWSPR